MNLEFKLCNKILVFKINQNGELNKDTVKVTLELLKIKINISKLMNDLTA